mgnify:CR=1 FL=1
MDQSEPENRPPQPPRAIPPAPPPAALLRPNVPHVPLTPMMDFLSRRLETLEKELSIERERAQAAQSLLQQQESLRTQVETQLKTMSDTFRREKAERDSDETKQHARGRIDALEKRLDEMHQSWVTLLREAVSQRESTHSAVSASQDGIAREQAGLKQEITSLQGAIEALSQQMGLWRADAKAPADAAPALRAFEGQIGQMFDHFAAELRDRVAAWERRQALELEKQEERLQNFAREKGALLRELEERDHVLRQESIKEKLHREQQLGEQFNELARRLEELRQEAAASRSALSQVHDRVTTTPLAKDKVIEALEAEKEELIRALRERAETLKAHLEQRREVEHTLGESLLQAHKETERLRAEAQQFQMRLSPLELDKAKLADELASAQRTLTEREQRRCALEAERDEISKTLRSEADKARPTHETWASRVSQLQQQFAAEIDAKTREANTVAELRGQMATLSDHLARALQERDASKKDGGWEKERVELLRRLEEKEQMISMLNATFRKFLK